MRKLIAAMKVSVDGKSEGPEGYADWVEGWSEDYGLTERIDACLLGLGRSSIAELSPEDLVIPPGFTRRLGG